MRTMSPYNACIKVLKELHTEHPNYTLSMHIGTALADYRDIWGISDKEMLFALDKYKAELDSNIVPETEVERIIEEGKNLDKLFTEDDEWENE